MKKKKNSSQPNSQKSSRRYTDQDLKRLWGYAAGRCALPHCRIELYVDANEHDPAVSIGDIAHIEASSDSGPRSNKDLSLTERDSYDNLVLLCSVCHRRLDGQKRTHTTEFIKQLKKDHEAWVRASLPERGKSSRGWMPVAIYDDWPVDLKSADEAISPDHFATEFTKINCKLEVGERWQEKVVLLKQNVETLLLSNRTDARFAVFPLARVTACIALGHFFSNRSFVRAFQYHRDEGSWRWHPEGDLDDDLTVKVISPGDSPSSSIAILFELSSKISMESVRSCTDPGSHIVSVSCLNPSTGWLKRQSQLDRLGVTVRFLFEQLGSTRGTAPAWHLFYAGPAPGAVKVGQQINPTTSPEVQLYEFAHPTHYASARLNLH